MKIKIEIFSSGSHFCSGCVEILRLADEIEERYGERVEVERFIGEEAMARLGDYGFECVPAMVIQQRIMFEGVCPSFSIVEEALKEVEGWQ